MIPQITMRDALNDPALFGTALAGNTWLSWKVLLIAAWGEKLDEEEREIFRRLTGRESEAGIRIDELVLIVGRKGGKSRIMGIIAVYIAALCRHDCLVRGERGVVLCVAQNREVARVVFDFTVGLFEASPLLRPMIAGRTQETLQLNNGISIEIRTASFRALRGPTYVAALLDEIAFWFDEAGGSANPDTEIVAAIAPALGLTHGPLIMASSPYARRGVLWERFRRHYGPEGSPRVLVARGTTRDLNPNYPQAYIDAALRENPAKNRAEYLAEFRTDVASFLDFDVIEAAVDRSRPRELPPRGFYYRCFVDAAGGAGNDSYSLAIAHREGEKFVVDVVRATEGRFDPVAVTQSYTTLVKQYKIGTVIGDYYGAEWVGSTWRRAGIVYTKSALVKSAIYLETLPLFMRGAVGLPDDERLIRQLQRLELRTSRAGKDVIDHGRERGAHDDIANASCGALHAVAAQLGGLDYSAFATDFVDRDRRGAAPPPKPASPWDEWNAIAARQPIGMGIAREFVEAEIAAGRYRPPSGPLP